LVAWVSAVVVVSLWLEHSRRRRSATLGLLEAGDPRHEHAAFHVLCTFVSEQTGCRPDEVMLGTELQRNFGLDGDDAGDFMTAFFARFDIDPGSFEFYLYLLWVRGPRLPPSLAAVETSPLGTRLAEGTNHGRRFAHRDRARTVGYRLIRTPMSDFIVTLFVVAATGSVVLVVARWMNEMQGRASTSRVDGCLFGLVGIAAVCAGAGLYLAVWYLFNPMPRGTYGRTLQVVLPLSLAVAAILLSTAAWSILRRSRITLFALVLVFLALVALAPFL
jgi:hypothetical protein